MEIKFKKKKKKSEFNNIPMCLGAIPYAGTQAYTATFFFIFLGNCQDRTSELKDT